MSVQVQHRRDTRAVIMGVTPAVGELGFATDTHEMTMGDGVTLGGTWAQKKNQSETLLVSGMSGTIDSWSPAGYSAHTGAIAMVASAPASISGIVSFGVSGRTLTLYNIGSNPIKLLAVGTGSLPQQRFSLNGDLQLDPNGGATLIYDTTNQLWYVSATTTSVTGTGTALLSGNNLSDVASASSSRTNLGLGSIATQSAGAVAVTGGTIDGTVIGATARAAGNVSTLGVGTSSPRSPIEVSATAARLTLTDPGQATDAKSWDMVIGTNQLSFRCANDAYTIGNIFMSVTRSAANPGAVVFPSSAGVTISGSMSVAGTANFTGVTNFNGGNVNLTPTGAGTVNINPVTAGVINNMTISGGNGSFLSLTGKSGGVNSAAGAAYAWNAWNTSDTTNAGGVIGISGSAGTAYGILGYRDSSANMYSFYGSGQLYNSGIATFASNVNVSGALTVTNTTVHNNTVTCNAVLMMNNYIEFPAVPFFVGYGGGANVYTGSGSFDMIFGGSTFYQFYTTTLSPANDASMFLGNSAKRWASVWSTTGTIQTSDTNEKQDIRPMNSDEMAVGQKLKSLLCMYRWKKEVAEQGDKAQLYAGIIAQNVEQAFADQGLDPNAYSIWRNDPTGDYQPVPGGDPIFVPDGGSRYSIDYNQVMAFILASM